MANHAELLTVAYEALGDGDAEPILALYEPGAVLHPPDHGPFSGPRSVAQFREALDRLRRASGGAYRIRAPAILTEGEHAIVLEEHSSTHGDARAVAVYHMVDGKIRERWLYLEDREAQNL